MSIQKLRSSKLWTRCDRQAVTEFYALPRRRSKTLIDKIALGRHRGSAAQRTYNKTQTCSSEDVQTLPITSCQASASSHGQINSRPQTNSIASRSSHSHIKRTLKSFKTTPSSHTAALLHQALLTLKRSATRGKVLTVPYRPRKYRSLTKQQLTRGIMHSIHWQSAFYQAEIWTRQLRVINRHLSKDKKHSDLLTI